MLLRFDGFRDFDRMFDELRSRVSTRPMPMDAYRRGDSFILHLDLPGVDPDSIDLTVDKDVLTVKAERTWSEQEGDEVVVRERPQGTFQRELFLSDSLDRDHLEARYDNGVLTVQMPLREAAKPRRIPIAGAGSATPLDTDATETSSTAA